MAGQSDAAGGVYSIGDIASSRPTSAFRQVSARCQTSWIQRWWLLLNAGKAANLCQNTGKRHRYSHIFPVHAGSFVVILGNGRFRPKILTCQFSSYPQPFDGGT